MFDDRRRTHNTTLFHKLVLGKFVASRNESGNIKSSHPAIRYLRVMIDARFNFKQQVEHAVTKETAVRTVLVRGLWQM